MAWRLGRLISRRRNTGLCRKELVPSVCADIWLTSSVPGKLRVKETDSNLENASNVSKELNTAWTIPYVLPQVLLNFILPAGFPGSVSDDYIYYMLWQFPCNVAGWASTTIVTSSLLKAVGIDAGAGTAGAATAAIKWVTKDGLGAIGRLFIGGHFGSVFDEDPKQWRMFGDLIGSSGSILELVTPLFPASFLVLASLGYLCQAMGKGLAEPCFRVAQTHFAINENVGDIVAKEEVWEVVAQLWGLCFGVFILSAPGMTEYWRLAWTWIMLRAFHLYLRYRSLSVLRLYTINYKRAQLLISAHVQGSPVPGRHECNIKEKLMVPRLFLRPRVHIGSSLRDLLGPEPSPLQVKELLRLYHNEKYLMVLHPNRLHGLEARVLFKEGMTSLTILRSMWQACWLLLPNFTDKEDLQALIKHRNWPDTKIGLHKLDPNDGSDDMGGQGSSLSISLQEMQQNFDSFVHELEEAGWDTNKIVLRLPNGAPLLSEL